MSSNPEYIFKVGDRVRCCIATYSSYWIDCKILEVNDQNTNSETSYHLRPLIATDYTKLVWKTGYMSVQDIHNRIKKFKQKKYFVANAWTMQKIWMRNEKIMWELKR